MRVLARWSDNSGIELRAPDGDTHFYFGDDGYSELHDAIGDAKGRIVEMTVPGEREPENGDGWPKWLRVDTPEQWAALWALCNVNHIDRLTPAFCKWMPGDPTATLRGLSPLWRRLREVCDTPETFLKPPAPFLPTFTIGCKTAAVSEDGQSIGDGNGIGFRYDQVKAAREAMDLAVTLGIVEWSWGSTFQMKAWASKVACKGRDGGWEVQIETLDNILSAMEAQQRKHAGAK